MSLPFARIGGLMLLVIMLVTGCSVVHPTTSETITAAPVTTTLPPSTQVASPDEESPPIIIPVPVTTTTTETVPPVPPDARIIPTHAPDSDLTDGSYCTYRVRNRYLHATVTKLIHIYSNGDREEPVDFVLPSDTVNGRVIFFKPRSPILELTYATQSRPAHSTEPNYYEFTYLALKDTTDVLPTWQEFDVKHIFARNGFVVAHPEVSQATLQAAANLLADVGEWYYMEADSPKPC